MEIVNFHYVQEEYDDGELYIPRREITLSHNQEEHGTISDVVDAFKDFLSHVGYMPETISLVTVRKRGADVEEENL